MSTPSPDLSVGFPLAHRHNRELQEGSQGHVQQWTHVQSGIVIAVKVIARTQHIPPEVEILRDLPTDKSIVKYLPQRRFQSCLSIASLVISTTCGT